MPVTDSTPADKAAFGVPQHMSWRGRTTLSARQWWSGFDDYLALQKTLGSRDNVVLESGRPANGIGATIAFDVEGVATRETLITKDDVNFVWKVGIPEANPTFLSYECTARIEAADAAGCDVSYSLDFILSATDRAAREAKLSQRVASDQATRVDDLSRFVLDRDGLRNQFTFPVGCPIDQLWAVVGDWRGVAWVQGASHADVLPNGRRVLHMDNGASFEERLWSRDDKTTTLVYEPILGPMPVRMYVGTLALQAISAATTQVTYSQLFIPKDGVDGGALKVQLGDAFCQRFRWIQQKFERKSKS